MNERTEKDLLADRRKPHDMTEAELKAERDEFAALLRQGRLTPKQCRRLRRVDDALDEIRQTRGGLL
jgi:hypothetical protein